MANRALTIPARIYGYWPEQATNIDGVATLGDRITRGRVKARLSQAELAKAIGVTRSWIGAVETDRIARPRPTALRQLADTLGLDYRELLGMTNQLGDIEPTPPAVDVQSEVVEALRALTAAAEAQAEAMREIATEMRATREGTQGRAEGMAAALGELTGMIESLRPLLAGRSQ